MRFPALRPLCFGGILAVFTLAGCGGGGHPRAPVSFSWYVFGNLQDTGTPGLAIGCAAAGAVTVVVTLTDVAGKGAPIEAAAPCSAGATSIPAVPPGDYYADFALYGDANLTILLDSFSPTDSTTGAATVYRVGPGSNDFTASYAPFVVSSPGSATFSWYVFDIETGTSNPTLAIGCAAAGAGSVAVTLTGVSTQVPKQSIVPCTDGTVAMANVPSGAYYAAFDLYGDPAIYGNSTTRIDGFQATDNSGQAMVFTIGPGSNSDFTDLYAPFVVQSFTVSWRIFAQGVATTCAAVGASYVDLAFMTLDPATGGTTNWVTSRFPCTSGTGASDAIPYGPTQVQWALSLVDAAGRDLQTINGGTVTLPTDSNVNLPQQSFSF